MKIAETETKLYLFIWIMGTAMYLSAILTAILLRLYPDNFLQTVIGLSVCIIITILCTFYYYYKAKKEDEAI